MQSNDLSIKYLDAAIKTMERNRALLFTISLLAALILAAVYLDRYSFDTKQAARHLVFYKSRCDSIQEELKTVPGWDAAVAADQSSFSACADLDKISAFVVRNVGDGDKLKNLSEKLYKLHVIRNEMDEVRLPQASMAPLGIGLPIPRNDMFILCGALLVVLYLWLAFSFGQLANITEKIDKLFSDEGPGAPRPERATVHDLVEINFLFDASKGGVTAVLVRAIYLMAPVSMSVAFLSDYVLRLPAGTEDLMNARLSAQAVMTVILWAVSVFILKADKRIDRASAKPPAGDPESPGVGRHHLRVD
jgi:hypothetical protein